jgi:hypothetical protein
MAKLVVLLLTPRTYLPMEIFSFSKGFRLYKLLIKCESLLLLTPTFLLLLNKPTISEAYKSTGLTVIEITTNLAIYGELGKYPLYIDRKRVRMFLWLIFLISEI